MIKKFSYCLISRWRLLWLLIILNVPTAWAENREINLVIGYKTVNFTGKSATAIAVNNQIPGPTLHFKEGDHVVINVLNQLNKGTAVHWHGLIVPWQMDGVEGVTQAPIPPNGSFRYEFTLKQSGTYWYHAHAGLQEQQGLYGGLIIDPPHSRYHYNKDFLMVLSDWSNTAPEQILANLKKDGGYYSTTFPLQATLLRFLKDYKKATPEKEQELGDTYSMMQQMRMSPYDISDVSYDTFLLNGHPSTQPWKALVKVGDTVRLRFIGAGASSFFHIKIPGTKMRMVHVQGNDIKPYATDSFTIAPGETYDILVKIERNSPYLIYAESADQSGKALGALVTDINQSTDFNQIKPFPEPKPEMGMPMDMPMSSGAMNMSHDTMNMDQAKSSMPNMTDHNMNMSGMNMDITTKYDTLTAITKTNNPHKPFQTIEMRLNGYMERYVWFINGVPEYKAEPILIEPGKRYRLVFINETMMHHPMHLHGHWLILRNGHGEYDPLLHTIDIPPGATVSADFDADANSGYWYFHCHNLYHMMSGMARIFSYEKSPYHRASTNSDQAKKYNLDASQNNNLEKDHTDYSHLTAHPMGMYFSNKLDFSAVVNTPNSYRATFESFIGSDYNKLQLLMNDAEFNKGSVERADLDIFYWRLISEFWAVKGGANYVYRPTTTPYTQPGIGIEGLAPYFIHTDLRSYYHNGAAKLDLELSRDTHISKKFFIRTSIRGVLASKTVNDDEVGSGLNFVEYTVRPYLQLTPSWALYVEWNHADYYGALKNSLINEGRSTVDNTLSLGVSWLF